MPAFAGGMSAERSVLDLGRGGAGSEMGPQGPEWRGGRGGGARRCSGPAALRLASQYLLPVASRRVCPSCCPSRDSG